MLTHYETVRLISHLRNTMPRAPEFTAAEWTNAILLRNAITIWLARGGSLPLQLHTVLEGIDAIFTDFAAVAWQAFEREQPELARKQGGHYWHRLRDAAAPSPAASPNAARSNEQDDPGSMPTEELV